MKRKTKPAFIITRYDKIKLALHFKTMTSCDGLCYNPYTKQKKILIHNKLGKKRKLNVLIEEICHAFFYDEPEYKVRKFSAELGRIIYNQFITNR